MQILLSAPALSGFNLDSVRQYTNYRFRTVANLLRKFSHEYTVRISIRREGNSYQVSVEIPMSKPIYIQSQDVNLFAAIDEAHKLIRRAIKRERAKNK